MSKDFFAQVADRRADAIAELDAKTFAPLIRNHLVQLFRKAHEKDGGLEGLWMGMGSATPKGCYLLAARDDEGNIATANALDWGYKAGAPMYQEVADFFSAAKAYTDRICHPRAYEALPEVSDITPADLEPRRVKKARVWGPNGLRARMGV